jgi:hypothetical protein
MSNKNYNFNKSSDMEYNPEKYNKSFYQICQIKNEHTNKHGLRKIIFNEQLEVLKIYEKEYPKHRINKFIEMNKNNKFKIYPVSDISLVGIPKQNDMFESQSELLNNSCTVYGNMTANF